MTVAVIVAVVVGLATLKPKTTPASVNRPPVAHFFTNANNLTVVFNGSTSDDPDGNITSYSWNFGDEKNGTGEVTTHTYPANGTYSVVLTVTDNGGAKNSTSKYITVSKKVSPPPTVKKYPVALIELESRVNLTVNVSGSHSYALGGKTIVSYQWTFGDGTSASGVDVKHTYTANGTYTITLTVTDSGGLTNSTTHSVTVNKKVTPPPPHKLGPPGLLHAIEIHELKADRNSGLKNSLEHLEQNLDRWLDAHVPAP